MYKCQLRLLIVLMRFKHKSQLRFWTSSGQLNWRFCHWQAQLRLLIFWGHSLENTFKPTIQQRFLISSRNSIVKFFKLPIKLRFWIFSLNFQRPFMLRFWIFSKSFQLRFKRLILTFWGLTEWLLQLIFLISWVHFKLRFMFILWIFSKQPQQQLLTQQYQLPILIF